MQRSAKHKRVHARLRRAMALLIRGRSKLFVWNGPGSAKQRYTLHRVRDTRFYTLSYGNKSVRCAINGMSAGGIG